MIYKFREGITFSVKPEVVAERLEVIRKANDGLLIPRTVVKDARPKRSPLHPCFDWDVNVAAERWWEYQATRLIRSVVTVENEDTSANEGKIIYVGVGTSQTKSRYMTVVDALSDEECRHIILAQALAQLRGIKRRYESLHELSLVWDAIDSTQASLAFTDEETGG